MKNATDTIRFISAIIVDCLLTENIGLNMNYIRDMRNPYKMPKHRNHNQINFLLVLFFQDLFLVLHSMLYQQLLARTLT